MVVAYQKYIKVGSKYQVLGALEQTALSDKTKQSKLI